MTYLALGNPLLPDLCSYTLNALIALECLYFGARVWYLCGLMFLLDLSVCVYLNILTQN